MVNSRLDYCNVLCNRAPAATINKLQRAQNATAHTMLNSYGHSDATSIALIDHCTGFQSASESSTRLLFSHTNTYKVTKTSLPAYLSCHLVQHVPVRSTRSTVLPQLTVPAVITEFARRSFSYFAPHIWNSLPGDIIMCDNIATCKRTMKTHLFKQCFMWA
jgi:hypothetical protein